jgi:hypothetical protein
MGREARVRKKEAERVVRPRRRFSGEKIDQRITRPIEFQALLSEEILIVPTPIRRVPRPGLILSRVMQVAWSGCIYQARGALKPKRNGSLLPSRPRRRQRAHWIGPFFSPRLGLPSEPRHALSSIHYTASDVPSPFLCIFGAMNRRVLLLGVVVGKREQRTPRYRYRPPPLTLTKCGASAKLSRLSVWLGFGFGIP